MCWGQTRLHNSYQHTKKNLISLSLVPEKTYRNKRFCIVKKVIFVQICKSWGLHDRVLDNSSVHATLNYVFRTLKTHKKPNKIIWNFSYACVISKNLSKNWSLFGTHFVILYTKWPHFTTKTRFWKVSIFDKKTCHDRARGSQKLKFSIWVPLVPF